MKKIFLLILLISFLLITSNAFSQENNYSYTGRLTTKYNYFQIDNDENSPLIPEGRFNSTLFMLAREDDMNMHLLADYIANKWDGHQLSKFHINISRQWYEFDFGDFYEQLSRFTVYYKDLRGVRLRTNLIKFKNSNQYRFKILGNISQSQEAVESIDKIEGVYNAYAESPKYQQKMALIQTEFRPVKNLMIGGGYLKIKDNETSLEESPIVDLAPIENEIRTVKGRLELFNRKFIIDGDYNISIYEEKFDAEIDQKEDEAYQIKAATYISALEIYGLYQMVGTDYQTAGYQYLENDKEGYKGGFRFNPKKPIALSGDYEYYENNLENSPNQETIETQILTSSITLLAQKFPELRFTYRQKIEESDLVPHITGWESQRDRITTRYIGNLNFYRSGFSFNLSAGYTDTEDNSIPQEFAENSEQVDASVNLRARISKRILLTGGAVYNQIEYQSQQNTLTYYNGYGLLQLWLMQDKIRLDINGNYQKNESDLELNEYTKFRTNPALHIYFSTTVSTKLAYIIEKKDSDESSTYTANGVGVELSINF